MLLNQMKYLMKEYKMAINKFLEILQKIPQEVSSFNRLSMGIAAFLDDRLKENGMTQKALANIMAKKESEISKWMGGKHNFTIKSIANLEAALGTEILSVNQTQPMQGNGINDVSNEAVIMRRTFNTVNLPARTAIIFIYPELVELRTPGTGNSLVNASTRAAILNELNLSAGNHETINSQASWA